MRIKIQFQTFNDGICQICEAVNTAKKGNMPVRELQIKSGRVPYERRKVGIQRFYNAKQEGAEVELLIRVPQPFAVSTQDICIVKGVQYGIYQTQDVLDTIPKAKDLSLKRLEEQYDVTKL